MLEGIVFALFAMGLFGCVFADFSILYALLFGYALFFGYGLYRNHSIHEMLVFSYTGIHSVKNILITFLLIGIITAIWRACGTIAFIVYYATDFCTPSAMILATFLLCCLISFLTGTAFGSAATKMCIRDRNTTW